MKKKKLSSIVNLNLESDAIIYGKKYTRVLKTSELGHIVEIINDIGFLEDFKLEDKFKLLMNFNTEEYYILQTTNKFINSVDKDEIRSEFVMELYKSFYSLEPLTYNEKMLKKNKKVKKEIAPYQFSVNSSYIEEDKGFCIINVIESINNINDIGSILKENDIWLSIDFNKLEQEKMLNIIEKIEKTDFQEVNLDKFTIKHIHEFKEKLKNEDIIQCEFKILHFNKNLDNLNESNVNLINTLRRLGINIFQVKERLNIIKAFNSSIYPYTELEVTHSLNKNDFIRFIGGEG